MKLKQAMILVVLLSSLVGCSPFGVYSLSEYSAEPIEAWVIDAETKQPIEGVIVVAHWVLEGGMHWDRLGELMILEAVSDQDGRYYFPAWGPKAAIKGWLANNDPELLFFKPGYAYRVLRNPSGPTKNLPVRRSVWDGKTIELEKFKGSLEAYAEHVYDLSRTIDGVLDFARGGRNCNWKKMPQMLVALHNTSLRFKQQRIKLFGRHVLRIEDIPDERRCGNPKEFLKSYLP